MSLSNLYIDAFLAVAENENFSLAAQALFVTQSALSQRVKKLEEELGQTLFIREASGVRLTSAGETLLIYGQNKRKLEEEVLNSLSDSNEQVAGTIRIGAFSSVLRSVVIKSLAPFLRSHPNVHCEFKVGQINELPGMLKRAQVDLIILDYPLNKNGVVQKKIGEESYVLIENPKALKRKEVYLDHDSDDQATELYFSQQKRVPKKYKRNYMGDIYGVIEGVAEGLGRAVVSKHLIKKRDDVRVVKGMEAYKKEVTLHYYEQAFYTRLHKLIENELLVGAKRFL